MSVVRARFTFHILACLAVLFVSLVLLGMCKPLDHDEYQFVAAAALRASSSGATLSPKSSKAPALWQVCAGALLGAAIGTRLTFAPAFLALAVTIAARPSASTRQRWAGLMRFTVGVAIALAPSLW